MERARDDRHGARAARCCRPKRRRFWRSSTGSTSASSARFDCCSTAAAASSSPAWASRASSAGRSPPRSSSTGTPAFFLHPAEAIHGDLGVIQADDVVLALSYSGETEELLRLLETIKRLGARLIAITGDCDVDAGAGGRRRARLPRVRGSVPAEPGADRQHDRRAGARRRAGHDAARRQGIPAGGLRQPASRAASWASG